MDNLNDSDDDMVLAGLGLTKQVWLQCLERWIDADIIREYHALNDRIAMKEFTCHVCGQNHKSIEVWQRKK